MDDKELLGHLVANTAAITMAIQRQTGGQNLPRDYGAILGYGPDPTVRDMLARYERGGITSRVVNAYPQACWASFPEVVDDKTVGESTIFESTWNELAQNLRMGHYFSRMDILASLGRFGVMFLGINDGGKPSDPVIRTDLTTKDLMYLRPYGEVNCRIVTYETDTSNPRFGKPKTYSLTTVGTTGLSQGATEIVAHWSRVLHTSEFLLSNDVFGTPRLKPIWDLLTDLIFKVLGGSAEVLWLNARGGVAINVDPLAQLDSAAEAGIKEQVLKYTNELQRFLTFQGADTKVLEMAVADPSNHVKSILEMISGATGIPLRILIGSERGELASTQDETAWSNRIKERLNTYIDPGILRPFIDRLIAFGIMPKPKQPYTFARSESSRVSDQDRAGIANTMSQAILNFSTALAHGNNTITPRQFVEEILQMEYKEAELDDDELDDELPDLAELNEDS